MALIESRLRECSETLSIALNPVDRDDTFSFEGQDVKLAEFLPILFKHLNKVILKHESRAEEILDYLTDAILYVRGLTDEAPAVVFLSPQEFHNKQSAHREPKLKFNSK